MRALLIIPLLAVVGCQSAAISRDQCKILAGVAEGLSVEMTSDFIDDEEKAAKAEAYAHIIGDLADFGCDFIEPE